jgi:hypothetical protein
MNKKIAFVVLCLPIIASCSSKAKDTLGLRRTAPDEFKVISNPPLSLPPEFTLRPPSEAAEGAAINAASSKTLLEQKVSGSSEGNQNSSKLSNAESAFLSMAGTVDANPSIKAILKRENAEEQSAEENKTIMDKLSTFSTKGKKEKTPDVVDAKKERERIIDNKEQGKSVTEGETPTADPDERSVLQKIFGK